MLEAARVNIRIATSVGDIDLVLYADKAPVTVANFLRYVDEERLNGGAFYRAMRPEHWVEGREMELVQGGIGMTPERMLPPIEHESPADTGVFNKAGAISMARTDPGTACSEFFICLNDCTVLDPSDKPTPPHDGLGFAAFGEVTHGLDVVRKIQMMETSDEAPIELLKGQILEHPVVIERVYRL